MASNKKRKTSTTRKPRLATLVPSEPKEAFKPDFTNLLSDDAEFVKNGYLVLNQLHPGKEELIITYVDVGRHIAQLRKREEDILASAQEMRARIDTLTIVFKEKEKELHGR